MDEFWKTVGYMHLEKSRFWCFYLEAYYRTVQYIYLTAAHKKKIMGEQVTLTPWYIFHA